MTAIVSLWVLKPLILKSYDDKQKFGEFGWVWLNDIIFGIFPTMYQYFIFIYIIIGKIIYLWK